MEHYWGKEKGMLEFKYKSKHAPLFELVGMETVPWYRHKLGIASAILTFETVSTGRKTYTLTFSYCLRNQDDINSGQYAIACDCRAYQYSNKQQKNCKHCDSLMETMLYVFNPQYPKRMGQNLPSVFHSLEETETGKHYRPSEFPINIYTNDSKLTSGAPHIPQVLQSTIDIMKPRIIVNVHESTTIHKHLTKLYIEYDNLFEACKIITPLTDGEREHRYKEHRKEVWTDLSHSLDYSEQNSIQRTRFKYLNGTHRLNSFNGRASDGCNPVGSIIHHDVCDWTRLSKENGVPETVGLISHVLNMIFLWSRPCNELLTKDLWQVESTISGCNFCGYDDMSRMFYVEEKNPEDGVYYRVAKVKHICECNYNISDKDAEDPMSIHAIDYPKAWNYREARHISLADIVKK